LRSKTTTIPEPLLVKASELVSRHTGLYFPEGRRNDLERGLRPALRDFGFEDVLSGIRWLISSVPTKSQVEVLARHLTVGETYFFRGKRCFDFLEKQVFSELIGHRRNAGKYLRVWSAGCCTGEEPYSIAILLKKILPDIEDWNISILGTDINPLFLEKASMASYGNWSFRDSPKWIRERFFRTTRGNLFELLPEIKKRVDFVSQNLAENTYSPLFDKTTGMDVVLCRNVLMYLTASHQEEAVGRLKEALVDGGWLIVSPSEVSDSLFHEFEAVSYQGGTFYRNSRRRDARKPTSGMPGTSFVSRQVSLPGYSPGHLGQTSEDPQIQDSRTTPLAKAAEDADEVDLYGQALSLYEKSLFLEATEKLRTLLAESPGNGMAAALWARICADQGNLTEAIALCDRAIAAGKTEAGHYYLRGVIFHEQGRTDDAAADLRRALYLDQDFVPAHLLLGNLALQCGKRQESARHFRNVLTLLRARSKEEMVPGAEGLTVGRIREMIRSTGFEDAR
jgi:chemotaxis protein methyltransferase CheR